VHQNIIYGSAHNTDTEVTLFDATWHKIDKWHFINIHEIVGYTVSIKMAEWMAVGCQLMP